jgi:F-type H+-transporting ATPase subunit a
LLMCFSLKSFCGEKQETTKSSEKYNPTNDVLHHIEDAHEWHFWGKGEKSVSIPLPVILYTEGKIDVFMSSKFKHGHADVVVGERVYFLDHGKIKERNGLDVFDVSITKNIASMLFSISILLVLLLLAASKSKNNDGAPKGIQGFMEPLVLFVRDDIIKSNIGPKYEKYTMFLLTVFFFILINNLTGMMPGSANVTGNISVTAVLSLFTFVIITVSGNKGYWSHIVKPPGTPTLLLPIMVPIEIFGIFTKPAALMIRLFANITAGHIIILSLVSLIFVASNNGENMVAGLAVAPLSVLFVLFVCLIELLVAFLQAYIFTLLSAVFIGLAVKEEH